jgi:hypothetical protein
MDMNNSVFALDWFLKPKTDLNLRFATRILDVLGIVGKNSASLI